MQQFREEKDPFIQLLILCGLLGGGFFLASIVTVIFALFSFGPGFLSNPELINSADPQNIISLKIQLILQQAIVFLVPALLLAVIQRQRPSQFYGMKQLKPSLFFLVLLIMMVSFPLMAGINELNQKMHLPGFLKGLEGWMRKMEDLGAETTKAILKADSVSGLALNLLVIAIVPAICEEFLFRGALQRSLIRAIKNHHVGIWISAIIFSAIHLQFFGFFPRLFLGAGFGYIYYFTGNLRYTIFAHFLNNGYAVCVASYLQMHHLPLEKADEMNVPWFGYAISAILTLALFKFLKDKIKVQDITGQQNDADKLLN